MVTPMGVFSYANMESLIAYNGLGVLDFDGLESINVAEELRDELFNDPRLRAELAFVSPSGRRGNSLGTVYHLAKDTGVDLKNEGWKPEWQMYKSFTFNFHSPSTLTHTRVYNNVNNVSKSTRVISKVAKTEADDDVNEENSVTLPVLANYDWPRFLQRCIDCGDTEPKRDALWITSLAVLGATVAPLIHFYYGNRTFFPNLQIFIVAPAAAGKGVIMWAYQLGQPLQERLQAANEKADKEYNIQLAKYNTLGKQRSEMEMPQKPPMRLFYISGNNTGTGVLENLADAKGVGCIFSAEADEVSAAIAADYGHWSDTLRKTFDHERLSYNRRANKEYREIRRTWLSLVLSGTKNQVQPLVSTRDNGLFSRILFYYMPPFRKWANQLKRNKNRKDFSKDFLEWGRRWEAVMGAIKHAVSKVEFMLTDEQADAFNERLASLFTLADSAYEGTGRSVVTRIAINLLRLMSMVAWLRSLDDLLMGDKTPGKEIVNRLLQCPGITPGDGLSKENIKDGVISQLCLSINDDDFKVVLSLSELFYRHSTYMLTLLPKTDDTKTKMTEREQFLHELPLSFSRQEAVELATKVQFNLNSMDTMLRRMVKREELIKAKDGYYRFNTDYKKD